MDYVDSYEIDNIIEEHHPNRDDYFYDEIDILKKKIEEIKKLIKEVNEYFSKESNINIPISNKLFDIETIVNKEK